MNIPEFINIIQTYNNVRGEEVQEKCMPPNIFIS